jgi:GntR family transcriptional regulator/MocR family aminotransferase
MVAIDLFLDPEMKRGATRSLFQQLRDGILSGRFAAGDRLPASRELAAQLGISRHTVTTVYGRLVAEGFAEGRAGGGTVVGHVARVERRPLRPAAIVPHRVAEREPHTLEAPQRARFDLRPATPDPRLFPLVPWRQCVTAALQVVPPGYGNHAGLPELRRALARWVGRSRSVVADPDQVIVTAGTQQAIDLLMRVLVGPGDLVAIENPGYAPVRRLCSVVGGRVAPVPVDAEGIVVDAIPPRAKIVFTTPSHQSPTGATMSLTRRRALLTFAERHGAAIVEDDYDSEYRYDDRPLEPLHALDRSGRVIYIGTFSKTLSPSLRLGFAVFPESLVDASIAMRELMDLQPPVINQQAMVRFIADGHLERHLRKCRKIYRPRHQMVTEFVNEHVATGRLRPVADCHAGLHVAAHLTEGEDELELRRQALAAGVALGNYSDYWADRETAEPGVLIGFGAIPTDDLPIALATLAGVLADGLPAVSAC